MTRPISELSRRRLSELALFSGMDGAALNDLMAEFSLLSLPGGDMLFAHGDAPEALYVVLNGGLGVYRPEDGREALIGRVGVGEVVGEMALIADRPRMGTVRALRDSELLKLSRQAFDALVRTHPRSLLRMARGLIARLEQAAREHRGAPHTVAVLALHEGLDAQRFAEDLGKALAVGCSVRVLDADRDAAEPTAWFSALEGEHRFVLYPAGPRIDDWREFSLRQADLVLFLARAGFEGRALATPPRSRDRPRHLVLLQDDTVLPGAAARWQGLADVDRHHHVRGGADIARLARLIARRGLGLVLSGGGARGFAHVGMIRALREAGFAIDAIGGTSLGAIVAAGVAMGWDDDELAVRFRRSFVEGNPLGDYTFPFVALTRGSRVSARLRREFGDTDIEDLLLPYFCVSTSLSAGATRVHDQGRLWRWLRASCAIPGLLPPVLHEGELLVDGGVIDNLPVHPMLGFDPGRVLGCEVAGHFSLKAGWNETELPPLWRMIVQWYSGKRRNDIGRILLRAGMVNSELAAGQNRTLCDVMLRPPVDSVDLLGWRAFDKVVELGYRHAAEAIDKGELDGLRETGCPA
ncbi:MAG TPA: patatin-like phospholipase family protein [Xanthomonadaceae bacterium]|nr:patatin-like phospholipase family protein [Xanthomonadaceae bacterium]